MSKQQQKTTQAPARDAHLPFLVVRTKGRPRFRRCGLDFEVAWRALNRKEIGPDIDRRLHEESMLEVRAVTEEEAFNLCERPRPQMSTAELEQALDQARAEITRLQGELARLQGSRVPGTEPPKDEGEGKASTARLP